MLCGRGHRHDEYPSIFVGTNISSYHIISHQKDDFPVCKVGYVSSAERFFPSGVCHNVDLDEPWQVIAFVTK